MGNLDFQWAEIQCLPVLVVPNGVLFPGIVIPLELKDPSECEMIRDVLATDSLLALALPSNVQPTATSAELCNIAGAGQVIHSEHGEGGGEDVLVQGVARVILVQELPRDRSYRRFRTEIVPKPDEAALRAAKAELAKLESCVLSLVSSVAHTDAQLVEVVRSTPDPVQLADVLAATVVSDLYMQQELLATLDLRARLGKLIDAMAELIVRTGEIPEAARAN